MSVQCRVAECGSELLVRYVESIDLSDAGADEVGYHSLGRSDLGPLSG